MRKVAKQQWLLFSLFVLMVPTIAPCALGQLPVEVPYMQFPSTQASFTEKPGPIAGWNQMGGWCPEKYEFGISNEVFYKNQKCAFIRSANDGPFMFGRLHQTFKAKRYRNKRMRFSAIIKSDVIDMSATLSMKVLGPGYGHEWLVSDNMYGRNVTGSRDWERYKVVLDVPEEGDFITLAFEVDGRGEIWISSVAFDETGEEPTADPTHADEPRNLDFSSGE